MPSHRANTSSDKDTRKSRAVRLGALLLAVVGVTAAATSAGFTNDAWFSANASSASVSLQGRIAGDDSANWTDADNGDVAITIPAGTFGNMLPGQVRTIKLDLKNSSTVPLTIKEKTEVEGDLLDPASDTEVTVGGFETELAVDETTTATLTVTAGEWGNDLQDKSAEDNTITVIFTGTPAN